MRLLLPSDSVEPAPIRYSVVVPVYGNAATLPQVVDRLTTVANGLDGPLEVVFVVDGSPDDSLEVLQRTLPDVKISSQLVTHSRNFGSFPAIRTGLAAARGEFIGVMAADLQEPPELMEEFFARLGRHGDQLPLVQRRAEPAPPGVPLRGHGGHAAGDGGRARAHPGEYPGVPRAGR